MKAKELRIKLAASGEVSGLLDFPASAPKAALALAHGAGAGMRHAFMASLAEALAGAGFAVLRYQFPYMEAGQKRTDSPAVATATVAAAVETLKREAPAPLILAGGKSFGARMTTTAESEGKLPGIDGIVCFGFPLHPAKEPSMKRAEHLARVSVPTLFLQGTRDDLADLDLMKKTSASLPKATLKIIEAADHGFSVLKRSGRTDAEVLAELVRESAGFRDSL